MQVPGVLGLRILEVGAEGDGAKLRDVHRQALFDGHLQESADPVPNQLQLPVRLQLREAASGPRALVIVWPWVVGWVAQHMVDDAVHENVGRRHCVGVACRRVPRRGALLCGLRLRNDERVREHV
eukprot:CAMPEP_0178989780 /NCGR_PEP_ID=MMETSP0795-20121207/4567_1 /TAXON_ID=88552 /ORGANISM="Amoebophrya sp., Strain Ameob2" /LENGTH=124 /DNA_ID=CAMNT_0020681225 /DNA_START=1159 /DNA_END=1533 /DNA_ORIENTATION=-